MKKSGKPDFRFNTFGFRKKSSYQRQANNCGLLSFCTPTIDNVGFSTRESIIPKYFNGDGVWYGSFGLNNEPLSYIDHTTGLAVNTSTDGSGNFVFPTNGVRTLTIDGKTFTPNEISSPSTQFDITSTDGTTKMQSFLTPADWVKESIQGVNDLNLYGLTNADGSTIYKDEALTQLYDADQPIQALQLGENKFSTSLCKGWISDGQGGSVHAPLEHKGQIKRNPRVVDGVVDYNTDNYSYLDPTATIVDGKLRLEADGATYVDAKYDVELKPSTEYTIVWDITENTLDALTGAVRYNDFMSPPTISFPLLTTGEFRSKFTTLDTILNPYIWSFTDPSATSGTYLTACFKIYEGDYVTGNPPLPEIGEAVDGNSIILTDANGNIYPEIAKTDTTNTFHVDYTADVPVAKTVSITTLSDVNNQYFVTKDGNELKKLQIYDDALTGDCLQKALNIKG